jgi:hypothetical protein
MNDPHWWTILCFFAEGEKAKVYTCGRYFASGLYRLCGLCPPSPVLARRTRIAHRRAVQFRALSPKATKLRFWVVLHFFTLRAMPTKLLVLAEGGQGGSVSSGWLLARLRRVCIEWPSANTRPTPGQRQRRSLAGIALRVKGINRSPKHVFF